MIAAVRLEQPQTLPRMLLQTSFAVASNRWRLPRDRPCLIAEVAPVINGASDRDETSR